MAKQNKRRAKTDQKIKCEYSGCTIMFARDSDRRRHGKEQHGPPLHCSYPGCNVTAKRMSKLGTHLKIAHHHQVSINLTIPPEFRNTNAQTLASPNHFSTLDANSCSQFDPTTPFISIDYAISPQAAQEAFQSEGDSISGHNRPLGLLAAARARTRVPQNRVYKRCRAMRRRKPRPSTHTSSAAPSHSNLDSAMQTTPAFYPSGQENPNGFPQWMSHTFNAESFANVLDSLSLLDSSIAVSASTAQQPTGNTNWRKIEPVELKHPAVSRNDTSGWDMIVEQ